MTTKVFANVGDVTITVEAEGDVWDSPNSPGVKPLIDALTAACYVVEHHHGLGPGLSAELEQSALSEEATSSHPCRPAPLGQQVVTGAFIDTPDGPEEIVPGPDDDALPPAASMSLAGTIDHLVDRMLAVLNEEDLSMDGPSDQAITRQLADKLQIRPLETREPIAVAREKGWVKTVQNDRRKLSYLGITRAGEHHLKSLKDAS